MTTKTTQAKPVHPAARMYAEEFKAGKLSRREFLVRASALGVTTAALTASSVLRLRFTRQRMPRPAARCASRWKPVRKIHGLMIPPQFANFSRGWLKYLVEYNRDGTFNGVLVESWKLLKSSNRMAMAKCTAFCTMEERRPACSRVHILWLHQETQNSVTCRLCTNSCQIISEPLSLTGQIALWVLLHHHSH